ncbi:MAG: carbonic anhydrase [Candidatus Omnitrophota bacterium]
MKQSKQILIALTAICVLAGSALFAKNQQPVTADDAVRFLKEGNKRFIAMKLEHPNLTVARREVAAIEAQQPFAIVLGCSDSRVPVEEVFDRGIGDIFVIRVAGNVGMDSVVIGSAEYAAVHLGAPVIVVLGHTGCGAVKAAISGPPLEGSIREIQKKIEPVVSLVKKEHPDLEGDALTTAVVRANVVQTKQDLLASSPEITHMAADGKIRILTAVYDMSSGAIEWIE